MNKTTIEIDGNALRLRWYDSLGFFGVVDLYEARDGHIKIITETMGKDFAKQLFNQLIEEADLID